MNVHLAQLGEFLRARRNEMRPSDVGLYRAGSRRRVPGLRREEVAGLVSISTDYYARLEQGRLLPSAPVLNDLAKALGLDEDQTAYMFTLAGKSPALSDEETQAVQPHLQRLLDDLSTTPAFVVGRRTQLLAWNAMGKALLGDFGRIPAPRRQFLRMLFTDPAMRALYSDWEEVARLTIAQLRMDAVRYPEDPALAALVAELGEVDAQFAEWWGMHDVALRDSGVKSLNHPAVGSLELNWNTLASPADPSRQIVAWTAAPGSISQERLLQLAETAHSRADAAGRDGRDQGSSQTEDG